VKNLDVPVYRNMTAHRVHGRKKLQRVDIGPILGGEATQSFDCDLLVTAVGLMPRLSLLSMGRSRPEWDPERQILRIFDLPENMYAVGEVEGSADISRLLQEGMQTGIAASKGNVQPKFERKPEEMIEALPADIESGGDHHFICKCMDVTRKEACVSIDEGFDQVESLKRYTSMGMGPCQGKSCHEAVARLAAKDTGLRENEAVPTTMRPPAFPVSFGLLSGRAHHLGPIRRTPMHPCHIDLGVKFLDAGAWKRPDSYTNPQKEALTVREGIGIIDVSTLGKIELSGPDVIDFMHFMLPGKFAKLEVGRTRYAIMIGEDGILFEDGTISQIEKGKYYISTTTGNQDAIYTLFQWWLTTGNYDVQVKNLSGGIAGVNITGPKTREFLSSVIDLDFSNEAFPYMHNRQANLDGVPLNLFRIGFTGELGYEIHFPSEFGESVWNYFMDKGVSFGLKPFGVETQRILRLEKGHLIPGADTDALSNPYEAGVEFAIRDEKEDFIGKAFLAEFKQREIENRLVPYRLQKGSPIPTDGVAVIANGKPVGRITSSRMSPTLGYGIGMAWVPAESAEAGSNFNIRHLDGTSVMATVLDHAAYDPEGTRLKN
ncbi:MAG: glycine cleavage T C-terminal barrel domain-containing protein, partial [SAR324 cluster bacterium]|nr:glycine cleavage T C-terminal barrel domain-containing protein [SAR324 cluster bacterium]